ncbi:MAG: hypothetical protein HYR79_03510 [Nitrospirae bacterium]|nr:hypothetical protein [Nitrospirota bacterium]
MKLKNFILAIFVLMVAWEWGAPKNVMAIPAFARKYDMDCNHCHTVMPQLNHFGARFRDSGFQISYLEQDLKEDERGKKEDPEDIHPAFWPVSIRGSLGLRYKAQSNQNTTTGAQTVDSTSFGLNGFELIGGGIFVKDLSYYFMVTPNLGNIGFSGGGGGHGGGGAGQLGELTFWWVRADYLFGSSLLNVKAGADELDLPFSSHRSLTLAPYDIYHYTPMGHETDFKLGEPQLGVEVAGFTDFGFRYALSVVNGTNNEPDNNKAKDLYAHLTQTVSNQRIGVFGYFGKEPTLYLQSPPVPPATGAANIPGTGFEDKPFSKIGADLSLELGDFRLMAVYLRGKEDKELFKDAFMAGTAQDASYQGGFIELQYQINPLQMRLIGRADRVKNLDQGDSMMMEDTNDMSRYTLAVRWNTVSTNRVSFVPIVEFSDLKQVKMGPGGEDVKETVLFGGVEIAF